MRVVRDGAIDALHVGHVAVVDATGRTLASHGDPDVVTYPRSAVKPFQAAAVLGMLVRPPPPDEIAVMSASHTGARVHQAAALRVLDRAHLTAADLRCPQALPTDAVILCQHPEPTRIANNCSGKHAGFLLATVTADADPTRYLDPESPVQVVVRTLLGDVCGIDPRGPGVDGCGAPAWLLPLSALARGFARLGAAWQSPAAEAGSPGWLAAVADAMRIHPDLVGGAGIVDTELMRADLRLIAKRGAEGTAGLAVRTADGPVGVGIKVSDGAVRALGPVAVAVLDRLGLQGPADLRRPLVLGGGTAHGAIEVTPDLAASLAPLI